MSLLCFVMPEMFVGKTDHLKRMFTAITVSLHFMQNILFCGFPKRGRETTLKFDLKTETYLRFFSPPIKLKCVGEASGSHLIYLKLSRITFHNGERNHLKLVLIDMFKKKKVVPLRYFNVPFLSVLFMQAEPWRGPHHLIVSIH